MEAPNSPIDRESPKTSTTPTSPTTPKEIRYEALSRTANSLRAVVATLQAFVGPGSGGPTQLTNAAASPSSSTAAPVATEAPSSPVDPKSPTSSASLTLSTAPKEVDYEKIARDAENLKDVVGELRALVYPEPEGTTQLAITAPSPAAAQAAGRQAMKFKPIDRHAIAHLAKGLRDGRTSEELFQELADQGYEDPKRRSSLAEDTEDADDEEPPYFKHRISESVFLIRNAEGNYVLIDDPAQKVRAFNAWFGRPNIPKVVRRPLSHAAAVYFVQQFRKGIHGLYIMNDLENFGFLMPSWNVLDRILGANTLNWEDVRVHNLDDSIPYDGLVWDEIVIPEELIAERKPFDRTAAKYIVKLFRKGEFAQTIMDCLEFFDYELPSWETFDQILEANGESTENELALLSDEFTAAEERTKSRIVFPEGIFNEGA